MDSRLREALEKIRDRDWVENALDPQWAAGVARDAILAAEPEPCEDARKIAENAIGIAIKNYDDPQILENDITIIAHDIDSYATRVADKRSEELRAQLDRANATLEEVAAQRNRAMEDIETLREFVAEAVEWSEAYPADLWPEPTPNQVDTVCRSLGFSIDRIAAMVLRGYTMRWSEKARALLAATEPKPQGEVVENGGD